MGSYDLVYSQRGTVRGRPNKVRSTIDSFLRPPYQRSLIDKEKGRIVIYVTSIAVIRSTYDRCRLVRRIFFNHRVHCEFRDISANLRTRTELQQRMEAKVVDLPQIFMNGEWLGDADQILKLNESGELSSLLTEFPRIESVSFYCEDCGGLRYVPCLLCLGSKVSPMSTKFSTKLKCMKCNEKGLVRCANCPEQQEDLSL